MSLNLECSSLFSTMSCVCYMSSVRTQLRTSRGRHINTTSGRCSYPACTLLEALTPSVWTGASWANLGQDSGSKLWELGFTHSDAETCLYVHQEEWQVFSLAVYTDYLPLAVNPLDLMDSVKVKLSSGFKMRDLEEAKYILGIESKQNHALWSNFISSCQYWRALTCLPDNMYELL